MKQPAHLPIWISTATISRPSLLTFSSALFHADQQVLLGDPSGARAATDSVRQAPADDVRQRSTEGEDGDHHFHALEHERCGLEVERRLNLTRRQGLRCRHERRRALADRRAGPDDRADRPDAAPLRRSRAHRSLPTHPGRAPPLLPSRPSPASITSLPSVASGWRWPTWPTSSRATTSTPGLPEGEDVGGHSCGDPIPLGDDGCRGLVAFPNDYGQQLQASKGRAVEI